jgi:hypothetical protein
MGNSITNLLDDQEMDTHMWNRETSQNHFEGLSPKRDQLLVMKKKPSAISVLSGLSQPLRKIGTDRDEDILPKLKVPDIEEAEDDSFSDGEFISHKQKRLNETYHERYLQLQIEQVFFYLIPAYS